MTASIWRRTADTHLRVGGAVGVELRVPQLLEVHLAGSLHLLLAAPPHKDGLAAPLDCDCLPHLDL